MGLKPRARAHRTAPPTEPRPVGRPTKHPWATMTVGDHFDLDATPHVARSMAYAAARRYQRQFSVRACEGYSRVYRLA